VKSCRGNTCAQVFLGVKRRYIVFIPLIVRPMHKKNYSNLSRMLAHNYSGKPRGVDYNVTNSVFKNSELSTAANTNKVRRGIKDIKNRALNLTNNHYAPENYWDYAYECVTELINNKAVRHLNCRTLYESLHGETPDISIVHYYFYESIHHMEPLIIFPQHIHTMLRRKVLPLTYSLETITNKP
jgi:hypothetical protein